MKDQLSTLIVITWFALFIVIGLEFYSRLEISNLRDVSGNQARGIAELKKQLSAKIPEPIKFYTIPGYDCNTAVIPKHCIKQNITQAEYDEKNAPLFNVTE